MKTASTLARIRFTQALKTAAAGIAALSLARMFRLPQPYWAAISAFVVMGTDISKTISDSRDRLIGTAVGAVLGAAFVMLWGSHLWSFGLATAVAVSLCAVLDLNRSYRLACVTVAIVMLIKNVDPPWQVAVYRFLEVGLGIVVALVVAALPPKLPA